MSKYGVHEIDLKYIQYSIFKKSSKSDKVVHLYVRKAYIRYGLFFVLKLYSYHQYSIDIFLAIRLYKVEVYSVGVYICFT